MPLSLLPLLVTMHVGAAEVVDEAVVVLAGVAGVDASASSGETRTVLLCRLERAVDAGVRADHRRHRHADGLDPPHVVAGAVLSYSHSGTVTVHEPVISSVSSASGSSWRSETCRVSSSSRLLLSW